MFKKIYESMNEKVTINKNLMEDTMDAMNKDKGKNFKMAYVLGGLAVCACLIVCAAFLTGNDDSSSDIKIVESFTDSGIAAKLYFDPETTHEEEWDMEEVLNYLGKDPRPSNVPSDLKLYENDKFYVIMNNDGTAAYDNFIFSYSDENEDMSIARSVTISASKGKLSPTCVMYLDDENSTSYINGKPLVIGHKKESVFGAEGVLVPSIDVYYAEFMYDDIGYRVTCNNLTESEVIEVLSSILK